VSPAEDNHSGYNTKKPSLLWAISTLWNSL
jgi:hypothetical protein